MKLEGEIILDGCGVISVLTRKQRAAFSYNGPACSQSLFILKDIRDGLVSFLADFHSLSPSDSDIVNLDTFQASFDKILG